MRHPSQSAFQDCLPLPTPWPVSPTPVLLFPRPSASGALPRLGSPMLSSRPAAKSPGGGGKYYFSFQLAFPMPSPEPPSPTSHCRHSCGLLPSLCVKGCQLRVGVSAPSPTPGGGCRHWTEPSLTWVYVSQSSELFLS